MARVEEIVVRTKAKDDGVVLSTQFSKQIPESLDEAIATLCNGDSEEAEKIVYTLFQDAYVAGFVQPVRQRLQYIWKNLSQEKRDSLTQVTLDDDGEEVKTGTLPEFQQKELEEYINGIVPGKRAERALKTRIVGDPAQALMSMWDELTEEKKREIMEQISAKFGTPAFSS